MRLLLAIVAVIVLLALGGVLFLGAFPPQPRTEQIQRVIPNDKFQQR